jgi:hypothetical protein
MGKKVWKYEASIWVNSHETHTRKFYGLEALRQGYDGTAIFAYTCKFGATWYDDLDTATPRYYRDHKIVLLTDSGPPVSLIDRYAYQAAINDVRYAQTLVEHAGSVPDPTGLDMDDVRSGMIDAIIALRRPCIVLT